MTPSHRFAKRNRDRQDAVDGAVTPETDGPTGPGAVSDVPGAGDAGAAAPEVHGIAGGAETEVVAVPPRSTTAPATDVEPSARTAPAEPPGTPPASTAEADEDDRAMSTTRAAAAWLATAVSLVILVLLIILILENQETVEVSYLGLQGALPLGTALLIAAVAGGAIVTIVGVIRLTQLRIMARRARRRKRSAAKRN